MKSQNHTIIYESLLVMKNGFFYNNHSIIRIQFNWYIFMMLLHKTVHPCGPWGTPCLTFHTGFETRWQQQNPACHRCQVNWPIHAHYHLCNNKPWHREKGGKSTHTWLQWHPLWQPPSEQKENTVATLVAVPGLKPFSCYLTKSALHHCSFERTYVLFAPISWFLSYRLG